MWDNYNIEMVRTIGNFKGKCSGFYSHLCRKITDGDPQQTKWKCGKFSHRLFFNINFICIIGHHNCCSIKGKETVKEVTSITYQCG
jgi:hypothetical protein